MALTEVEQLLIGFLETSKAGEPEKTLAFLAFAIVEEAQECEDKMLKMCHYLSDNPEATGRAILKEARRIAEE